MAEEGERPSIMREFVHKHRLSRCVMYTLASTPNMHGRSCQDSSAANGWAVVDGGIYAERMESARLTRACAVSIPKHRREVESDTQTGQYVRWIAKLTVRECNWRA